MSALSHRRVIRGIAIPMSETGTLLRRGCLVKLDPSQAESRWKLHLRQIAASAVREQVQGLRHTMGAAINTPLST